MELPLVGLGLQAAGGIYDWYENKYGETGKRRKKEEEMADEQWRIQRQMLLQQMLAEKQKADWKRGFMRSMLGVGNQAGVANA